LLFLVSGCWSSGAAAVRRQAAEHAKLSTSTRTVMLLHNSDAARWGRRRQRRVELERIAHARIDLDRREAGLPASRLGGRGAAQRAAEAMAARHDGLRLPAGCQELASFQRAELARRWRDLHKPTRSVGEELGVTRELLERAKRDTWQRVEFIEGQYEGRLHVDSSWLNCTVRVLLHGGHRGQAADFPVRVRRSTLVSELAHRCTQVLEQQPGSRRVDLTPSVTDGWTTLPSTGLPFGPRYSLRLLEPGGTVRLLPETDRDGRRRTMEFYAIKDGATLLLEPV